MSEVLDNETGGTTRAYINALAVRKFYKKKTILSTIIESMMHVACINLELTDKELKLIEDVANVFQINQDEYDVIKSKYESIIL